MNCLLHHITNYNHVSVSYSEITVYCSHYQNWSPTYVTNKCLLNVIIIPPVVIKSDVGFPENDCGNDGKCVTVHLHHIVAIVSFADATTGECTKRV
jgi:hypothetical protein